MMDDEELGAILNPAAVRYPKQRPVLTAHPAAEGSAACDICGSPRTAAYQHPNPLRPGVVLYRCPRHRYVSSVRDDPKAAPGGGVYR
jgi:hypothetical protein